MSEQDNTPKVRAKPFAVATSKGRVATLQTLSKFAIKAASTDSRVISQYEDVFGGQYGEHGLVQPKYDPGQLKELLDMNTYHARACKTKAQDVAGSEWEIIDANPDDRKLPGRTGASAPRERIDPDNPFDGVGTADQDHPRADGQTASPEDAHTVEHRECRQMLEGFEKPLSETLYEVWLDHEATGAGAFEIVREGNQVDGDITDIVHIPIETLRKHRSGLKYMQKVGSQKVWYKDVAYQGELDYETGLPLGQAVTPGLFDERVFEELGDDPLSVNDPFTGRSTSTQEPGFADSWLRGRGGFVEEDRRATEVVYIEQPGGRPDIIPAIPALYGDQARSEYNISFFENYGVPSMMLLITGDYDPGEEDDNGVTEMEKFLEERLGELIEEPYSNLVVSIPTQTAIGDDNRPSVTIQAVPLNPQVEDASFRLYRQDNRDEILTANQTDPYRAQVIVEGQLGGNTANESTEIYKQSTLQPKQHRLEHRLNRWVIQDNGRRFPNSKISFSKIDTRDSLRLIEIAIKLFNMGAMTPNEVIENFRDVFKLGGTVDHPAMDLHYLNGQPIDSDDVFTPEMEQVVSRFRNFLGAASAGDFDENGQRTDNVSERLVTGAAEGE